MPTNADGLRLSKGLSSRLLARTGVPVTYTSSLALRSRSERNWHDQPDAGACFAKEESGGWVYASNAEVGNGQGGVYALEFDADGEVVKYYPLIEGTSRNCGGGKSPWATWLTCEEDGSNGQVYEVNPLIENSGRLTNLVPVGGNYESVAYENSTGLPVFFTTDDSTDGPLTRFIPSDPGPSAILADGPEGTYSYLVIEMTSVSADGATGSGTFTWSANRAEGEASARQWFPKAEGVDTHSIDGVSRVYFVSKAAKRLLILNLAEKTVEFSSTVSGAFNNQPDQIKIIAGDDMVYFCEDGGNDCGVHARDKDGTFYTILDGPAYNTETTGLAFSPNHLHMYVVFQGGGHTFDITRDDGRAFTAQSLDIKYHA